MSNIMQLLTKMATKSFTKRFSILKGVPVKVPIQISKSKSTIPIIAIKTKTQTVFISLTLPEAGTEVNTMLQSLVEIIRKFSNQTTNL